MSSAFAPLRSPFLPALAAACLAAVGAPRVSSAQTPGSLDTSFNGSAFAAVSVYTQVLEDYKGFPALLGAGDRAGLQLVNAADGSLIFRNPDGTLLPGFNFVDTLFGNPSGRVIYTIVPEIVAQPDGSHNLLVGGIFGKNAIQIKNKQPGQNIFRIGPFGVFDTTFNPGKGADNYITSIVPLPDGGMLVSGMFSQFNDEEHQHIVRLDNGGAIAPDSVFDSTLNFDLTVLSVATQTVGAGTPAQPQFVVGGIFTTVSGTQHSHLVRLNFNGSIDGSFTPTFDDRVTVVTTQPDGKILVGGDFINVNGEDHRHIVRLNYDGSVDESFVASVTVRPGDFVNPAAVYVIRLLDDGSMYVGGNFTRVNDAPRDFLARVDANGALDTTFDPGKNIINAVQSLTVREGLLYVGETATKRPTGMGAFPSSLVRLFTEPAGINLKTLRPTATRTGPANGVLKLIRNSQAGSAGPVTVYFQTSGTAVYGTDYTFNGNVTGVNATEGLFSVTFPAGNTTTTKAARVQRIGIAPLGNASRGTRTLTVTVIDDPTNTATYYETGASGTVTITN